MVYYRLRGIGNNLSLTEVDLERDERNGVKPTASGYEIRNGLFRYDKIQTK